MKLSKLNQLSGFSLHYPVAKLGLLVACLFASQVSLHADALIGGTTLDGNFEGSATSPDVSPTATGWVATGDISTVNVRSNNTVVSGNNVVLGRDGGGGTGVTIHFGRDTGHTIALGDRFDGGFSWLNPNTAFWDNAEDSINMILFYTDTNAIDGTRGVIATWNSGVKVNAVDNEVFSLTAPGAADAGVGKKLFVNFESIMDDDKGYARVDDVYLNATAIPEPSVLVLLGLAGISALLLRRRRL